MAKGMVSCKLAGRLGNFLFEVANVYAYAKRCGLQYEIYCPTGSEQEQYKILFPNIPFTETLISAPIFKEASHAYNEIPKYDRVVFDGYFQSYKYFDDCHDEIINDLFKFSNEPVKRVSIHVRRGDYVQYQDAFPLCNMDYYSKSVNAFIESGIEDFTVFSDDIEWCKRQFSQLKGNFNYSEKATPWEDMQAMANHEHNIISNSSFSLWAAMANRNKNKVVIAPHAKTNWFGAKTRLNTKDMLPESFLQVQFDYNRRWA